MRTSGFTGSRWDVRKPWGVRNNGTDSFIPGGEEPEPVSHLYFSFEWVMNPVGTEGSASWVSFSLEQRSSWT